MLVASLSRSDRSTAISDDVGSTHQAMKSAIDAAAAGSGPRSAKTCPAGTPSDWVITPSTCSHGADPARS